MASNFRFYYVPLYALFATLPLIWSRKVNEIVPEPYLVRAIESVTAGSTKLYSKRDLFH